MASKGPQLLLLSRIALVALASDSVSAHFCLISSSLGCPSCALLGQANCTPPMLMAPNFDKRKSGGSQFTGSRASKVSAGGGGSSSGSSGGGQRGAAQMAAAGSQSQTSGQTKSQNFSCKVGNAKVDWFIAIKKPNSHEYAFLSPEHPTNWKYAGNITRQGPVFNTLNQARNNPASVAAYSDKPPPNQNYSTAYGHLKGLFMFGQSVGFWMTYSARHFPSFNPFSLDQDTTYAHSFICITAGVQQLNEFSVLLANSKPQYYQGAGPPGQQQNSTAIHLLKYKGQSFNIFIKGKNSNAECIYQKIQQQYGASGVLRVQSWIRTLRPDHQSDPRASRVKNIKSIRMTVGDELWEWNNTVDHSKWCVSKQPSAVCISDLNRMGDPLTQGGAAVCLQHDGIWRAFNVMEYNMYTSY